MYALALALVQAIRFYSTFGPLAFTERGTALDSLACRRVEVVEEEEEEEEVVVVVVTTAVLLLLLDRY